MAFLKGQKPQEAAQDAEKATQLAPSWPKGYWRRGQALYSLKDIPGAIAAFVRCWQLQKADPECEVKLWQCIQKLTREQLAEGIIALLGDLQVKVGASFFLRNHQCSEVHA